jgi:hypothetical protein
MVFSEGGSKEIKYFVFNLFFNATNSLVTQTLIKEDRAK